MAGDRGSLRVLDALRHALNDVLAPMPALASGPASPWWLHSDSILAASAAPVAKGRTAALQQDEATAVSETAATSPGGHRNDHGDADLATSSAEDATVATRLIAL